MLRTATAGVGRTPISNQTPYHEKTNEGPSCAAQSTLAKKVFSASLLAVPATWMQAYETCQNSCEEKPENGGVRCAAAFVFAWSRRESRSRNAWAILSSTSPASGPLYDVLSGVIAGPVAVLGHCTAIREVTSMARTWRRSMICRYQHQTDKRTGRGYVGQEILHKIQMIRRAGRWVYPQNMAASGVDGGDDVGDVLVDQICG